MTETPCERCGTFAELELVSGARLCARCRARPVARLEPSERAKQSLTAAVIGLHLVFIAPVALVLGSLELNAINRGAASEGGRPYAQAARWLAAASMLIWAGLLAWWLNVPRP